MRRSIWYHEKLLTQYEMTWSWVSWADCDVLAGLAFPSARVPISSPANSALATNTTTGVNPCHVISSVNTHDTYLPHWIDRQLLMAVGVMSSGSGDIQMLSSSEKFIARLLKLKRIRYSFSECLSWFLSRIGWSNDHQQFTVTKYEASKQA